MKRVLYVFLAVGLAASLVGCGGGSGGYWSTAPFVPAGTLAEGLEDDGGAPAILGVANGAVAGGAVATTNAGVAGCPVFAEFFGVSMPSNLGQSNLPTFFASILGNGRTRKVRDAIPGLDLTNDSGWVKIAYSPKSSSSVAYEAKLEYWVRFLNASGNVLTYAKSTVLDDDFFKFSNGQAKDINTIEWYGSYEITTSYGVCSGGPSCSVLANGSSSSSLTYDYTSKTTFGSAGNPNVITNLYAATGSSVPSQKFSGTSVVSGLYNGANYNTTMTFELGGDVSCCGYTGLFSHSPSYGEGFYKAVAGGANVMMKAYGSYYEWYENGQLKYSSQSSSSSGHGC